VYGGLAAAWVSALLSRAGAQQPAPEGAAPSLPAHAAASPPAADDAARTKARALGYAGVEAYGAGDYSEASAKLEESFQLLPVPSLGLWSARALVGLGRWVVAEQRYRAVARLPIAPGDSRVQQQAKDDAQRERTELLRRIPSLKLRISGAGVDEVAVSVDGNARSSAELARALLLDPGRHEIVGVRGGERSQVVLTLVERSHEEIELRFRTPAAAAGDPASTAADTAAAGASAPSPTLASAAADAAAPGAGPSAALPARSDAAARPRADGGSSSSARRALRVGAWLGVGVGAAGLATSLVSYLLADRQYQSFERRDGCANGSCSQAEVDTYNDLRQVYQLSLIGGGIAGVAGATLLVLTWGEPSEQPQPGQQASGQRALRLELNPMGAALTGTF
jgi:hypothetical protein